MKIETKFEIQDTIYFLRPEDWDWTDSGEIRRVVEYAYILRIIRDQFLCYEVYSPEADERLTLSESELYATKEEAQKACTAWNKLHGFEEDKENEAGLSIDKDFLLKDCESALDRIEKKLDLLIGKVRKHERT